MSSKTNARPYAYGIVREAVQSLDQPKTINGIRDVADVDWHTAKKHLESLAEEGEVYAYPVNNRLTIYWREPEIQVNDLVQKSEDIAQTSETGGDEMEFTGDCPACGAELEHHDVYSYYCSSCQVLIDWWGSEGSSETGWELADADFQTTREEWEQLRKSVEHRDEDDDQNSETGENQ